MRRNGRQTARLLSALTKGKLGREEEWVWLSYRLNGLPMA